MTPARADAGHTLIVGSGSSWAANAVNQWIADVHSSGIQVVFTPSGSAQGRRDYANQTTDFAVSDIGYQGTDPSTGQDDTSQGRSFAYLPIVAGGTSLPYQINVGGQLVRNLRLSGPTIAKIFTNQITNWDDAAITADNNGHALPSLPIIPVVHSEGSGSTYQFTDWMATQYGGIWKPYAGVGATEYFPPPQGSQVAENGSDGVMNFVSSSAGNGSIGYDEYSYPLGKNYPVAKVLNAAGYYTLPNQYNVAVALTKAVINPDPNSPDYLLQTLNDVYSYGDPRVYPISSYSYAIIPTAADDPKMTSAKRQTIADYLDFSVCGGQSQMGPIGYSPLPINLVQASFDQIAKLHTADPTVDVSQANVSSCNNPTFVAGDPKKNYLAAIAPQPESCDKQGSGPCTDAGDTGQANPPPSNGNGGGTTAPPAGGASTTPPSGGGTGSPGGGSGDGGGSRHGGSQGNGGGGSGNGGNGGNSSGNPGPGGSHGGSGGNGGGTGSNGNSGPGGGNPSGAGVSPGGPTAGQSGPGAGPSAGASAGGQSALPTDGSSGGAAPVGGSSATSGSTYVDPVTGQTVAAGASGASDSGTAISSPVTLAASSSRQSNTVLAVIAGLLLVMLLVVPPLVAASIRRRRPDETGPSR